ncbi:MAG: 3-oxoacyl-ACP reductase [Acidimicrobiaceae bacterium]|nr:3-oxoacyl-ACP reductase [Acidimicrobiaceae bacterium]
MANLNGRSALVLAASGGLGSASALALARDGARVVGWGRNVDALREVGNEVAAQGTGEFHAVEVDLSDFGSIAAALESTAALVDDPDILVNITGGPPPGPISGLDRDVWTTHFESMVLSVISVTDAVTPAMRRRGWGRVITCTSSGVIAPIPNLGLSNSLRACLVGWSKTLASEVAAEGVTVNTVVPGRVATGRTQALDEARAKREGTDVASVAERSTASIPVGRYGDTAEFGSVVAFLASEQASYVNGSQIRVDGGMIGSV